ncbi:MAG: D-alanyl-D-alanine carboxypeptidase family protein [Clostridia bacterium]|nr:D-alanyl-D-alanine carboxypeptidase family protein [Clostridia bacterium]
MKRKNKHLPEIEQEPIEALSFEEIQLIRAAREKTEDRSQLPPRDQSEKAKLGRFARKNKLVVASAIVILLAMLVGIGFGIAGMISFATSRPNTSDITVEIGEEKPFTVPYDEMVRDGVLYVDLRAIAPFADLIVSGSTEYMQFASRSGTFLRFENDSEFARINGKLVEMIVKEFRGNEELPAKAILTKDKCYVPYRFLKECVMDGLQLRWNDEENILSFRRTYTDILDEEKQPIAATLLFDVGSFTVLPEPGEKTYEYSYLIDIEPYLESIQTENLLLANKQTPLGEDFVPALEEITVATANKRILYLDAHAARALEAMMLEMAEVGVTDVMVTSAYRSYKRQYELFHVTYYQQEKAKHPTWTDEQIYAEVLTYSAAPGTSEHQTGLCIDFLTSTMNELNNSFEGTPAFEWLSHNAHRFGFVLRYDKDKVDITGYSYESWHYRFVGLEAATEIYEKGICLEEYLAAQN